MNGILILVNHYLDESLRMFVLNLCLKNLAASQFCEGCVHDYQNRKDHFCIMAPFDEKVDTLFEILLDKINL